MKNTVKLAPAGGKPEALSGEFQPTAQSIRNWVVQTIRDKGKQRNG
jgi:transposase